MKSENYSQTILFVCRHLDDIAVLSRVQPLPDCRYILATDDGRFFELAKKFHWISEVCWLEKMESLHAVAGDVINVLEGVNCWLKNLAAAQNVIDQELFSWVRHCEGGKTTQRIQDALLLIRSYQELLSRYAVDEIFLVQRPGSDWEDRVLKVVAQKRRVSIREISGYRFKLLWQKTCQFVEGYLREAFYLFGIIKEKMLRAFVAPDNSSGPPEVVFQLCSSLKKHVQAISPLMQALKDRGFRPVALCWSSAEKVLWKTGARQLREQQLCAEELERHLTFKEMISSVCAVYHAWRKAKRQKSSFFCSEKLTYLSIPLGGLLWPSIRLFILSDLFLRHLTLQAAKRYFQHHQPVAIKYWGDAILAEGALLANYLREKKIFCFNFTMGVDTKSAYANSQVGQQIDLFFAVNRAHIPIIAYNYGVSSEKIVVTGEMRYQNIDERNKGGPTEGVIIFPQQQGSLVILYETGYPLRGYKSVAEYVQLTQCLFEYCQKHPQTTLLVKEHPSGGRSEIIDELMRKLSLKNVFRFPKKGSPYQAIQEADVVITKMSAVGFEAMLLGKPVVAALFDGEEKFKVFEDAAEYVHSSEGLISLLDILTENRQKYQAWAQERLSQQQSFCDEYFERKGSRAADIAAEAIYNALQNKYGPALMTGVSC